MCLQFFVSAVLRLKRPSCHMFILAHRVINKNTAIMQPSVLSGITDSVFENPSSQLVISAGTIRIMVISWGFEPSQPRMITPGLNTNFTLSPVIHFTSHHTTSHVFLACFYSAGTQHGNLPLAGWPILFCGPTQEPRVSHSQHRKNRDRFWKKRRWMDRKERRVEIG